MPTYHAVGIAATLSIAELSSALTPLGSTEPPDETAPHGARTITEGWKDLDERPTRWDDNQTGVMQFIGPSHDMPIYMVEVGSDLHSENIRRRDRSTPVATAKALRLSVDTRLKNADVKWPRSPNDNAPPNLKVEVFLNGRLVDVAFLNKSRNAVQLHGDTLIFQGTRIDRQLETPWVYGSANAQTAPSMKVPDEWKTVSWLLAKEAEERGCDQRGILSPTAMYLMALSSLPLPKELGARPNIGILDVVVTTGRGFKYGMEAGFLPAPVRMMSRTFCCKQSQDSVVDPTQNSKMIRASQNARIQSGGNRRRGRGSRPRQASDRLSALSHDTADAKLNDSPILTPSTTRRKPKFAIVERTFAQHGSDVGTVDDQATARTQALPSHMPDCVQGQGTEASAPPHRTKILRLVMGRNRQQGPRLVEDNGADCAGQTSSKAQQAPILQHEPAVIAGPAGGTSRGGRKRRFSAISSGPGVQDAARSKSSGSMVRKSKYMDEPAPNEPSVFFPKNSGGVQASDRRDSKVGIVVPDDEQSPRTRLGNKQDGSERRSKRAKRDNQGLLVSIATPEESSSTPQQDSTISCAPAGMVRSVKRTRTGEFEEAQLVVGMRFIVV